LALAPWPRHAALDDTDAEAEIGWVIDLISAIRSIRTEMSITGEIPVVLVGVPPSTRARAARWTDIIRRLGRLSDISSAGSAPRGAVQLIVRGEVAALPLEGVIDFAAERARLENELSKIGDEIARIDQKLGNKSFIERAPEEVVEEQRERRDDAEGRKAKVEQAIERLKGAVAVPSPAARPPVARPRTQPAAGLKRAKEPDKAKRKTKTNIEKTEKAGTGEGKTGETKTKTKKAKSEKLKTKAAKMKKPKTKKPKPEKSVNRKSARKPQSKGTRKKSRAAKKK
jgi:hypothetical protein